MHLDVKNRSADVRWPSPFLCHFLFHGGKYNATNKKTGQGLMPWPVDLLFSTMMSLLMVYLMTLYNIALENGQLALPYFLHALLGMWPEFIVIWIVNHFVVSKLAMRLAFRFVNPQKDHPMLVILSIQAMMVCCIVPYITLFATFFHHGFTSTWFTQWITLLVECFPMAFCLHTDFLCWTNHS